MDEVKNTIATALVINVASAGSAIAGAVLATANAASAALIITTTPIWAPALLVYKLSKGE